MADWTEQADQMLKGWSTAQQDVWNSWQNLAGRATGGGAQKPQSFTMNPMEWFQQAMSGWSDPFGVAGDAGRQVFGSQYSMMQNLDLLTKAWRLIAPQVDAGQDWRSGLSAFTTDWFEELSRAPGGFWESSKGTGALLHSFMNEWGPLLKPWISSAIEASGSGHLGEMMLGGSAGLSRLFTMEQDELRAAPFGGFAQIPSLGVNREHQAKLLRAFDAFVDLRKAMLQLNKMTVGALNKSVESVMEILVEKGNKGEKIESVRELNRLWLDSADNVFTKMYASEEYLKVQHEVSRAGMTYKIMQQDVLEMILKGMNLPTRSELDDAYKTLYELGKEVKSLKKALHEKAKPAIEAKTPSRSAVGPATTNKQGKRPAAKKVPVRKKTVSRTKSTD